ncbi:MAG: ABC transporter ATP-binding protein [Leptospiraceae bacterium]|nr:ABC transporter ATP-binding protein [Leptospiraceae bacterium]
MSQSLINLLKRLWGHFLPRRHKQFTILFLFIVIVSFLEMISLGAVIPFLIILTDPKEIISISALQPLFQAMEISDPSQLVVPVTITFAGFSLIAGGAKLLLLWINTRFSNAVGADISIDMYRKTLYQPYTVHVSRNSSEVISGITTKSNNVVSQIINPALTLLSSSITLLTILASAIAYNPVIALSTFSTFGILYILIALDARKRLMRNGLIVARENTIVIKSLQEGLGGIRDVLLNGSQEVYCEIYKQSDHPLRKANGNNAFIGYSPRYSMETLALVIMSFFAYMISLKYGGLTAMIPLLGALALGAQRMLPILQQGYQAWASIKSSHIILQDVLELLDLKLPAYSSQHDIKPLPFNQAIHLKNISFRYSKDSPLVLKDINLEIVKGSRVGFIGTTGSGKSTLQDIIMYLLEPTEGQLMVDDKVIHVNNMKSWQLNIANVPQSIFLSDSSIAENIAFGIPLGQIDYKKVKQAASKAQISDFIETLKDGYDTFVGERGIRLSGGQRQRIGIARALYREASLIVFDEATSALDNETERAVMESIDGLGKDLTILIIAHRLSTVKNCDKIVELSSGRIIKITDGSKLPGV